MLTTKLRGSLIILASLLMLPATGSPQRPPAGSPQRPTAERGGQHNFYEIQRRYNERFEAKRRERQEPRREGEGDDEETRFRRFEMFWAPRVDEKGEFGTYYKNLKAASENLGCDTCGAACHRANWTFMGPSSLPTQNMGAIQSVWVNPNNPSEILAGTYNTGLYKTTGGGTWTRLTNFGCRANCPDFPQGGVSSIAVDPRNTDVIYITVGINRGQTETYSLGVYKTTNGGLTWCPTDLRFDPTEYVGTAKVVMDPNDPNTLYASGGHKVYKTTDGGATWKANVVYTSPNHHEIQDIAVSRNPGSAGLYFSEAPVRCYSGTGCPPSNSGWNCPIADGKIWYDPNFGGGPPVDITSQALGFTPAPGTEVNVEKALFSVTPNSVSILALSDAYDPGAGCHLAANVSNIISRNPNMSPTLAASWTQHNNSSSPWVVGSHGAAFASAFAVSPLNDNLVMIGSDHGSPFLDDLYISNTGGATPTLNLNKDCLHADLRALAFSRKVGADEIWIVGNDGGVSEARVNATGTTPPCVNLNGNGLTVTEFFGISNSEADPSKIYAGAQDNGAFDVTTGAWRTYPLFDGYDVVSDVTNPLKAYMPINYGFVHTTTGGNPWLFGLPFSLLPESRVPNAPMVIDKQNTLYIAQQNVFRVYPGATAAVKLSQWNDTELRALHVPALNSSTIITAKNNATYGATVPKLFRTDSAHFNSIPQWPWDNITFDLPVSWQLITGITSDEKGENVWVGMGNFGRHVLLLRKGSTKWEDYSQGLPQLPVNVIKYWEGSGDDSLFVGTDTGVYYRNRNLAEWKRISCRLPNVIVSDLEINNRTQKLRVATRGMGVWEASLAAIKSQGCAGDTYLEATYTSFSGPVTRDLQNNAVVTDAYSGLGVRLTPKRVCCVEPCNLVTNYSWKVYRVWHPYGFLLPYNAGQNSPVEFVADFGHWWWGPWWYHIYRFNYRVEVMGACGDKTCPTLTVHFNAW